MSKRRVLYVLHNHPTVHPGGAEAYALELYEAMRSSEQFEPLLVARIGSTVATPRRLDQYCRIFPRTGENANVYRTRTCIC